MIIGAPLSLTQTVSFQTSPYLVVMNVLLFALCATECVVSSYLRLDFVFEIRNFQDFLHTIASQSAKIQTGCRWHRCFRPVQTLNQIPGKRKNRLLIITICKYGHNKELLQQIYCHLTMSQHYTRLLIFIFFVCNGLGKQPIWL